MSEFDLTNVALLRDHKFYLENFCKVKPKEGGLKPFILKEAQKDLFNTLNEHDRVIILKARQLGFCFSPETLILTSNLEWKKIKNISIGERIMSVDEFPKFGVGASRRMIDAVVENKSKVISDVVLVKMDNGCELKITPSHKMLCKVRGATHTTWREARKMIIGDEIRYIASVWGDVSYEDSWIAGIIDGEGSLRKKKSGGVELSISQVDGFVWDRIKKYFDDGGYKYRIETDNRKAGEKSKLGNKSVNKLVVNRINDIFKIIGKTRPSRFVNSSWWNEKFIPNIGWSKITSIESLGEQEMIDLQTSEKTYIAEGFISHNSTAITGYFYVDAITTPGINVALIGYNQALTAELLEKVKTLYRSTPLELRPVIEYNTKYEITFPRIDSKILVLPSSENVGSGYTLHRCLLTELPKIDKAEEKMDSLAPAIPSTGKFVIESSPRGMGNLFHRMWMNDNSFVKKMYPWWWEYSVEEIEVIKASRNDPSFFAQEYECAFLNSGRSVFNQEVIKKQRLNELKIGDEYNGHIVYKNDDDWVIYKEPEVDGLYVCGVDTSEGVKGGDNSVAIIFDRKTGEEVAFYQGLIAPDRFGELLNKMGRRYNNALMVVEINNHGLTTVTILRQLIYPTLYFRPAKFETMGAGTTDKIGWRTTKVTRPLLIDELAQALREDTLTIHSKQVLDEMTVFIYDDNNNMRPQDTFKDDCIFATGICLQGFKVMYDKPLTQLDYNKYLPTSFSY